MMRISKLLRDRRGSMVVETAVTLPLVMLIGLGTVQLSSAAARQAELQASAAEAEQIILAKKPTTEGDLESIRHVVQTTSGLESSNVNIAFRYRCGTATELQTTSGSCGTGTEWIYVRLVLQDTYEPTWTQFGLGSNIALNVTRMAQVQ